MTTTETTIAIGTEITYTARRGDARGVVVGHVARPFGVSYNVQTRNGTVVHVADVTPATPAFDALVAAGHAEGQRG